MITEGEQPITIDPALQPTIKRIDDGIIGDSIGLLQAISLLRAALEKAEKLISDRNYDELSKLGYEEIANNFVFLQWTIAGVQGSLYEKQVIIQDLALQHRCAYEDAQPHVEALMVAYKPSPRMGQ